MLKGYLMRRNTVNLSHAWSYKEAQSIKMMLAFIWPRKGASYAGLGFHTT